MKSIQEIRQDLREIRYYYSMKSFFDTASKTIQPIAIIEKVNTYNKLMENAPARMYILYVSLYVHNNTQAALADDWQMTKEYVRDQNTKLCTFLQSQLG